jgi:6-phosphogluconolactonase (cycloisomerase 2 family)
MVNFTILAGGTGAFIATYLFNSDAGSLALTKQNPTGTNPSWIGLHPTNTSILFAVNEVEEGAVQSFAIGADGILSADAIANISSGGNGPAHLLALSTGEVSVMNFGGGNGRVLTPTDDPAIFSDDAPVITFPANKSNPHETFELKNGDLLVPDLGADQIWHLKKNGSGAFEIFSQFPQPEGSGPRHIAVLGDLLLTLHETASTLTTQNLSAQDPLAIISQLSVIPDSASKNATFGAGEILLPPTSDAFPDQFIYVSNRNVSPDPADIDSRGDTVAIFSVDETGQLKLENQVFTGIQGPRGLAFSGANAVDAKASDQETASTTDTRAFSIFGDRAAEFLAVGGQAGTGGVVIMQRTEGGKNMVEVARNTEIPTRTSFAWL